MRISKISLIKALLVLSISSVWGQTLIEVQNLEQLNAIRYDLDGDGRPISTGKTKWMGAFGLALRGVMVDDNDRSRIESTDTVGYQLMANFDFDDIDPVMAGNQLSVWAEGARAASVVGRVVGGWMPIGKGTFVSSFSGIFDGNRHTISNIYINRQGSRDFNIGLFGGLGYNGEIRNLGIVGGSVTGKGNIGPLAGSTSARSTVRACYATANVNSTSTSNVRAGGLIGSGDGSTIISCYATGDVTGGGTGIFDGSGGLVGSVVGGTVIASYAKGDVTATGSGTRIGGLAGNITFSSNIMASYATGNVRGGEDAGGLVGYTNSTITASYATGEVIGNIAGGLVGHNEGGTIRASYYDSDRSMTMKGVGNLGDNDPLQAATAKTSSELRAPEAYEGIYATWNVDVTRDGTPEMPWDFGRTLDYPALSVDFDTDGTPTSAEFGMQWIKVLSFSPSSGAIGDEIKIAGLNFSPTATQDSVSFDGGGTYVVASSFTEDMTMSAAIADTLTVEVPRDAQSVPIMAKILDGIANGPQSIFTLIPKITGLRPLLAQVGDDIKIAGTSFSATANENKVSFGGSTFAAATRFTTGPEADTLTVSVPNDARTGRIMVMVAGQIATSAQDFVVSGTEPVPAPVISSFSPKEGNPGTEITIKGMNFSEETAANGVVFGGARVATPSAIRSEANGTISLTVSVPNDARTGRIMVMVAGQIATSAQDFVVSGTEPVPAPVISSFSPKEGNPGTEITIKGMNFSEETAANGVVFGGARVATPSAIRSEANGTISLTVSVPNGARTGRIMVMVAGQIATSAQDFVVSGTEPVPAPVISSFSPKEGNPGTEITIKGMNFSEETAANGVVFGGARVATPSAIRSEANGTISLTVSIPNGARTGRIMVMVAGQIATSAQDFVVSGTEPVPAPVISSFSPKEGNPGTEITIKGMNFSEETAANGVVFGGTRVATPSAIRSEANGTISLTVSVPNDARTGRIMVMVAGQIATSAQDFVVSGTEPVPAASVFSVVKDENTLHVYPNPTLGRVRVVGSSSVDVYSYRLYTLTGQEVDAAQIRSDEEIDLGSYPEGQYMLFIKGVGTELRTRLLILK